MAENIEIIKNYFTLSASVFVQSLTDASVKEAGSQRDSKNPSEHDHEVNHPLPINKLIAATKSQNALFIVIG